VTFSHEIPTEGKLKQWSEFSPEVYTLRLKLKHNRNEDLFASEFGFCEISHDGTKVLINDKPVFLRGNLDCVHFPLTAYASCELDDWMKIFKTCKDYGLNHVRFHSWCPPEAAFKAAGRLGIYMQAEASVWIDWWMSVDNTERGRPEMNTKGFPEGLGHNPVRDSFVVAEMNRVVDTYGNHPAFTMFCIGNELGNSDFEKMKTWVDDLKKKDTRRLYSVSTARTITGADDYNATHYIKGAGRTRGLNGARTDWDFEEVYGQMHIPIIAHEIGQWPVYPRWSEIDKYTGVLRARNFEEFKKQAQKNGIADQSDDFADASGALNQIMYKYETESFFRTASCAGIQLLSMQDYQGQGEALIGWLDAHWESKGITTPEKFREHFTTTVPLLRMEKFIWTSGETFNASAQLSHHGAAPLSAECNWEISNEQGTVLSQGTFGSATFDLGSLTSLGDISYRLDKITKAEKLTVSVSVKGTSFLNHWDIWVYPEAVAHLPAGDVTVTSQINKKAEEVLAKGGKVLLIANNLGIEETSVKAQFYPLYWSLTFFPGQGITSIGLLLQEEHEAFDDFPTSYHSDWQWESISKGAKGFILNDMPAEYKPIAQPVDDFHRNNKVGSIFEFTVGKGRIMVCGYDLEQENPVAKQLKNSLIKYMNSSQFNPDQQVDPGWLLHLLPYVPIAEAADVPDEFKNAILYIEAAARLGQEKKNIPWQPELDEIKIASQTSYRLSADGVWKDENGSAWHGKDMLLDINCPEGILGSLYVHFRDSGKGGIEGAVRKGHLEFEGRKSKLDEHHGNGQWVKFHVMREDSNDGKLYLRSKCQSGPDLMITKVVLVKE
jgi:hypothetical protein